MLNYEPCLKSGSGAAQRVYAETVFAEEYTIFPFNAVCLLGASYRGGLTLRVLTGGLFSSVSAPPSPRVTSFLAFYFILNCQMYMDRFFSFLQSSSCLLHHLPGGPEAPRFFPSRSRFSGHVPPHPRVLDLG